MADAAPLDRAVGRISDDSTIQAKDRAVVDAANLPSRHPDRMWAGRGAGKRCAVCGVPVTGDEVEYELEYARDGDDPAPDMYHIHVRCLPAWASERRCDAMPSRDQT
jgi:hypothetical protein